jgi:epoxyqueuosine reductase
MGERHHFDGQRLVAQLRQWARELGFSQIGVSTVGLHEAEAGLQAWLTQGCHGSMHYMQRHGLKRARPAELVPGTLSVITARMDYLPRATAPGWQAIEWQRLGDPRQASVSIYARGRDYHKVLRARLQALADKLAAEVGELGAACSPTRRRCSRWNWPRAAAWAGAASTRWLLQREGGSMFFLGEIFVDLALPATVPVPAHCGSAAPASRCARRGHRRALPAGRAALHLAT